jgi:hypothetical protein
VYILDFCKLLNFSPLSHWERVRVRAFWQIIVCLIFMSLLCPHPQPLSQRAREEICKSPVYTYNKSDVEPFGKSL